MRPPPLRGADLPDLLLVEDDPAAANLLKLALLEARVPHRLLLAEDGAEALDFLACCDGVQAALPRLILLDLNLPRVHGFEVLRKVKADGRLRSVPVIVLSASRADGDVFRAHELHANSYVQKPGDWHSYVQLAKAIAGFWLVFDAPPMSSPEPRPARPLGAPEAPRPRLGESMRPSRATREDSGA